MTTLPLDTIQQADALEWLKALPGDSVDCIITDPPYGTNIANWDKEIPPEDVLIECLRISKGAVVWFGAASTHLINQVMNYSDTPERILIWTMPFTLSKTSRNGMFYRWHPIYCWRLPVKQQTIGSDVISVSTDGHNEWNHPATKPLKLIEKLVLAFSDIGAIVCDPFMGSGTTAIAARRNHRHFIGCDLSAEYVELANNRLAKPYTPTMIELTGEM